MYMEFPGIDYTEKNWDSSQAIVGGATDICGVIGIFQKGPINKPTLCTTFDQVIETFGSYMSNAYAMYSIRGFFKNRGGSGNLYVTRVVHYADITDASTLTAKQASGSVKDRRASNAEDTLNFYDKWLGALGNTYGYKITDDHRVSVVTTDALKVDDQIITTKIVRNFLVGDYVKIADDTNSEYGKITSIDASKRQITIDTKLTNAYAAGAKVCTADVTIGIYRKTVSGYTLEKEFVGVNMDPDSPYYVESVINSQASGSTLVEVKDQVVDVEHVYEKLPVVTDTDDNKATDGIVYLTGGDDGLKDITDMDFIGDAASKTGNYAFDDIHDMIHVWCPESASMSVIRNGYDYWTSKMTGMFFAMVPSGLNPKGAADFRDEAGWNTSYGTLYHNWGYVTDPLGMGDNPEKLVPLTGHVLGAMGLNDDTNENEYGSAPAGEDMVLLDVNRLEFEVDEQNGGIMYGNKNRNVNPIIELSNNGGIVVWGSRTQEATDKKWFQIHARRIFIYAETNITQQTRWMVFKNKNDTLYTRVNRVVSKFLRGLKGLKGQTDAERFAFVCDSTINDPDDSYVIARIGLSIDAVAEFIWFEFGHMPDGISLSEV